jgi:hypothetical protein
MLDNISGRVRIKAHEKNGLPAYGRDPNTNTSYHEIPNTTYAEGKGSGRLSVSDLPNGKYTLYVLGNQVPDYWLTISTNYAESQELSGNIQAGTMAAYTQNYDVANLASSTFSYQGTVSSTVSITSALPQSFPPSSTDPSPISP